MGFRFGVLAVGPLWLLRAGEGLRVRWRCSPRYWGPMAMALPRGTHRLAERLTWYAAGGPVASLGTALAALAVLPVIVAPFPRSSCRASRLPLPASSLRRRSHSLAPASASPATARGSWRTSEISRPCAPGGRGRARCRGQSRHAPSRLESRSAGSCLGDLASTDDGAGGPCPSAAARARSR